MKKQILKKIFSSISATTIAATSLGLNTVLAASAENVTPAAHVHEADELTEEHDHDHGDCCGEHEHCGKGVTIALLDAGVTNFETAGKASFIDDDTIDSEHGNDMMSVLKEAAPEADVLDVRVLDDEGKGTYSSVEKGIRWSVDNNADIIVMSFVGENQSALLENALAYAEEHEVLVVASAGNYSSSSALYPAAYPTVISVGAVDANGKIQGYSNFGDYVDTYVEWADGTSGAAQYVAANAAVTMEQNPDITLSELRASYNAGKSAVVEASNEDNADTVVYSAATCKSHSYTSWTYTKQPTCTAKGVQSRRCRRCGKTETRSYGGPYGHSMSGWTTTTSATCTSPAIQTRKCTRSGCKYKETRKYGSALNHIFVFKQTAKAATCTTDGVAIYVCNRSGCKATQNRTIKAPGHSMSAWKTTTPATCTSPAIQTRQCTRSGCKYKETRKYGSALNHNFVFKQTAKAATCTTNGVAIYACNRPGCKATQNRTVKAPGHSMGAWKTTTPATCTSPAIQTRQCTRSGCKYKETRKYGSALGHNYKLKQIAKAVTCTTDGVEIWVCSNRGCNASQNRKVKATGHKWGAWTETKKATCTTDGSKKRTCSVCKKTETQVIPKLSSTGHRFNGSFESKPATCTEDGYRRGRCTRCGEIVTNTVIPKLGGSHNYGAWEYTTNPDKCTRTCSKCGHKESVSHSFNGSFTTILEPTYTTEGKRVGKCTRCGKTLTTVTVPKKTPQLLGTAGKNNREVYIVKFENDSELAKIQNEHPNAIIVADDTAGSPPNYHVYNSYKITDNKTIEDVCTLVVDYNTCGDWKRSAKSFAGEWREHNFIYTVADGFDWEDGKDCAQHVDVDKDGEGYPWIIRWIFN